MSNFSQPHGLNAQEFQPMEFSRKEYWSGLPFPSAGDLPDPGTESRSPVLQADSLLSEPPGKSQDREGAGQFLSSIKNSSIKW